MYISGLTRRWLKLATILVAVVACCMVAWKAQGIQEAHEVVVKRNLYALRQAIEVFKLEHGGEFPAARIRTAERFHQQMLLASNRLGDTVPTPRPGYWLGPYFADQLPVNPLSGGREVWVIDEHVVAAPNELVEVWVRGQWQRAGWIYRPLSGRIRANSSGRSPSGTWWHEL